MQYLLDPKKLQNPLFLYFAVSVGDVLRMNPLCDGILLKNHQFSSVEENTSHWYFLKSLIFIEENNTHHHYFLNSSLLIEEYSSPVFLKTVTSHPDILEGNLRTTNFSNIPRDDYWLLIQLTTHLLDIFKFWDFCDQGTSSWIFVKVLKKWLIINQWTIISEWIRDVEAYIFSIIAIKIGSLL